jgi:pyrophosphatase PpaX
MRRSDLAPEAVLFDFDGTLIDTGPLILESFRHTARRFLDRVPSDDALMRNVGVPLIHQMEELSPGRGAEMVAYYREHNQAAHDDLARPFPHVEEVLEELKQRGYPMAVVTAKGRTAVDLGVELIGLDRFIEVVITADDVEVNKPDPYPLRVAADRLGVDLTRSVYVGDSPHDMTAALRGGAVAVAALWGGIFPRERVLEPGPHHALEDIRELLGLLGSPVDEADGSEHT